MSRPRAIKEREVETLLRREGRATLAKLRVRAHVSSKSMQDKARELRALAKTTLAKIRLRAAELRTALRLASQAARELSRFIAPGARVLIGREHRAALKTLALEHEKITHLVTEQRARLTPRGAAHPVQKLRSTAAERAHESDDEVRNNVEPQLLPAFEAWKRRVIATPRMSRTEAFLQMVHDHPGDASRLYFEAAERAALEAPEETEEDYAARMAEAKRRPTLKRPTKAEREDLERYTRAELSRMRPAAGGRR